MQLYKCTTHRTTIHPEATSAIEHTKIIILGTNHKRSTLNSHRIVELLALVITLVTALVTVLGTVLVIAPVITLVTDSGNGSNGLSFEISRVDRVAAVGGRPARKVDVRLHGKENSNSHGARPVHQTITMLKWIRTRRLSMKSPDALG